MEKNSIHKINYPIHESYYQDDDDQEASRG